MVKLQISAIKEVIAEKRSSAPELLADTALEGFAQLKRIVSEELEPGLEGVKQRTLVAQTALGVGKLYARLAEAEFRKKNDDTMMRLLEQALALGEVPALEHEAMPEKKK